MVKYDDGRARTTEMESLESIEALDGGTKSELILLNIGCMPLVLDYKFSIITQTKKTLIPIFTFLGVLC